MVNILERKVEIRYIAIAILWAFIAQACFHKTDKQSNPTSTIDPYANTRGETHAFLGATVPSGTIRIGPQTRGTTTGKGYNYNDSIITGFILSYAGEGEETPNANCDNDIRFFPSTRNEREAKFVHSYEVAKPGYYSIYMHETDIAVELTATKHTAFQRYFFPPTDSAQVVIGRELTLVNDSVATGQTPNTHFIIRFSRPMTGAPEERNGETKLTFDATEEEMLYIKVGVSTESIEDADNKLKSELPDWNFEQMASKAGTAWSESLVEE